MSAHFDLFTRQEGYISGTDLGDGNGVWLNATITGGEIIRGTWRPGFGTVTDRWAYPTIDEAAVQFAIWTVADECQGEPNGWVRHLPSYRRRTYYSDGVVMTEEVRA